MGSIIIKKHFSKKQTKQLYMLLKNGGVIPLDNKLGIKVEIQDYTFSFALFALSGEMDDKYLLPVASLEEFKKIEALRQKKREEKDKLKNEAKNKPVFKLETAEPVKSGW